MRDRTILKKMVVNKEIILGVGIYDGVSARIADQVQVPALYLTGYGAAASMLGMPDIGLMTMSEMAQHVRYICAATSTPVIADADTGYGGAANVARTVREYEAAGVDIIQLEDQEWPKRCGHMEGKRIVAPEEMVARIKAAVGARSSDNFMIMARTDANAIEGFESAMRRAKMYREAGADILFVESPINKEQLADIPRTLQCPCLANMVEHGKTPFLSLGELKEMGFAVAIYPISTLLGAAAGVRAVVDSLLQTGTITSVKDRMMDWPALNKIVQLEAMAPDAVKK